MALKFKSLVYQGITLLHIRKTSKKKNTDPLLMEVVTVYLRDKMLLVPLAIADIAPQCHANQPSSNPRGKATE